MGPISDVVQHHQDPRALTVRSPAWGWGIGNAGYGHLIQNCSCLCWLGKTHPALSQSYVLRSNKAELMYVDMVLVLGSFRRENLS